LVDLTCTKAPPNWPAFYWKLCHVGPIALTGVSRELIPALQLHARTGDGFWSDSYFELLYEYWDDPHLAVEQVIEEFVFTVRQEFMSPPLSWFGPRTGVIYGLDRYAHEDEVRQIGHRLTPRLCEALVRSAKSPIRLNEGSMARALTKHGTPNSRKKDRKPSP